MDCERVISITKGRWWTCAPADVLRHSAYCRVHSMYVTRSGQLAASGSESTHRRYGGSRAQHSVTCWWRAQRTSKDLRLHFSRLIMRYCCFRSAFTCLIFNIVLRPMYSRAYQSAQLLRRAVEQWLSVANNAWQRCEYAGPLQLILVCATIQTVS